MFKKWKERKIEKKRIDELGEQICLEKAKEVEEYLIEVAPKYYIDFMSHLIKRVTGKKPDNIKIFNIKLGVQYYEFNNFLDIYIGVEASVDGEIVYETMFNINWNDFVADEGITRLKIKE